MFKDKKQRATEVTDQEKLTLFIQQKNKKLR